MQQISKKMASGIGNRADKSFFTFGPPYEFTTLVESLRTLLKILGQLNQGKLTLS
jgi:hypothetical protein